MFKVSQEQLIKELSTELKPKIAMPEWAQFVKTGMHKERPPVDQDWWYMRAASVLRQVYLKGPIGVSKLKFKYGGRKTNRGMKPEKFFKGSGKIIRTILQQLEQAQLVQTEKKGLHKGRVLTPSGKSFVFQISKKLEITKPVTKPVKVETPKPEVKVSEPEVKQEVEEVPKEKAETPKEEPKADESPKEEEAPQKEKAEEKVPAKKPEGKVQEKVPDVKEGKTPTKEPEATKEKAEEKKE